MHRHERAGRYTPVDASPTEGDHVAVTSVSGSLAARSAIGTTTSGATEADESGKASRLRLPRPIMSMVHRRACRCARRGVTSNFAANPVCAYFKNCARNLHRFVSGYIQQAAPRKRVCQIDYVAKSFWQAQGLLLGLDGLPRIHSCAEEPSAPQPLAHARHHTNAVYSGK